MTRSLAKRSRDDEPEYGPAMKALPRDQWRAFVLALFLVKPGHGTHTAAARMAGFGKADGTSTPETMAVIAHRIVSDDRVQLAIQEEAKKRLRGASPAAISALLQLIADPTHKDHARGIAMVLDRATPVETTHNVQVTHTHITQDESDVAELRAMKQLGASREKLIELFGLNGLDRIEAMIEAEAAKQAKAITVEYTEVDDADLMTAAKPEDIP